jgi:hypothetical protein
MGKVYQREQQKLNNLQRELDVWEEHIVSVFKVEE